MIVKSALNGCLAEVDDELGKKLVESGQWVSADSARKPRTRKAAPVEEPVSEE